MALLLIKHAGLETEGLCLRESRAPALVSVVVIVTHLLENIWHMELVTTFPNWNTKEICFAIQVWCLISIWVDVDANFTLSLSLALSLSVCLCLYSL